MGKRHLQTVSEESGKKVMSWLSNACKEIDALKADLAAERERAEGLRGALEGRHHRYCDYQFTECTCGLDQALLAAKRD